jgi:hypothetical protein
MRRGARVPAIVASGCDALGSVAGGDVCTSGIVGWQPAVLRGAASLNVMGLASFGLGIGIFCDFVYSVLLSNTALGLDFLGLALLQPQVPGLYWQPRGASNLIPVLVPSAGGALAGGASSAAVTLELFVDQQICEVYPRASAASSRCITTHPLHCRSTRIIDTLRYLCL